MANPEHVEIVKQGAEAILRWRKENPDVRLDLCDASLEGLDLNEVNLAGANLGRAKLVGTHLYKATLIKADLTSADLHGAFLSQANLSGASLAWANLAEADLAIADLTGAVLVKADLTGAHMAGASLYRANLAEANLTDAFLLTTNLTRASFHWANLFRTQLHGVVGAHHARHLETVRFTPPVSTDAPSPTHDASERDAREFDTCQRPWPERQLDWEFLRKWGRLPLFGISYTALILIPTVFYGLALYNRNIGLVHAWAKEATTAPDHPLYRFAPLILERLHHIPIPRLSFVLLVSTVLLAAASTLYTFFCPSRIKEFSRDQWCDQIGRSLVHYWPLAWKHRYIRLVCTACYALGSLNRST